MQLFSQFSLTLLNSCWLINNKSQVRLRMEEVEILSGEKRHMQETILGGLGLDPDA